jgi:hypothetical protein
MASTHLTIKRSIVGAYICFLGMTVLCTLLYPQIFDNYAYGISSFGSFSETMIPYYLGFAATIVCLVIIALQLGKCGPRAKPLRLGMWIGSILMAGIAATSYAQDGGAFLAHIIFAILLTLNQFVITLWIVMQKDAETLDYILAFVFGAVVLISILPLVHDIPALRSYPLREILVFICALGLSGRAALRLSTTT